MARKPNGKAATDTTAARIGTIAYDEAIDEAKEILARTDKDQIRLGELADKVQPLYGDRTLASFAKQISIAPCTLARYRSVYRAWAEIEAPGPVSYAVRRELQDHPDRAEIVKEQPNLTKAQARKIMREFKGEPKLKSGSPDWRRKGHERWFRAVIALANEAIRAAAVVDQSLKPADRRILAEFNDSKLLLTLADGSRALFKVYEFLRQLRRDQEEVSSEAADDVSAENVAKRR
jgi:hypothetical protein